VSAFCVIVAFMHCWDRKNISFLHTLFDYRQLIWNRFCRVFFSSVNYFFTFRSFTLLGFKNVNKKSILPSKHTDKYKFSWGKFLICLDESSGPGPWTNNTNILVAVSHLLITINSSANFLIYCYKVGGRFFKNRQKRKVYVTSGICDEPGTCCSLI
jgi:hypothetical protein